MKVVLDTNILLISIPSKSRYRPIFGSLIKGKYDLLVSNEILFEYAEIIEKKTTSRISVNVVELLMTLRNVYLIEPHFKWNLIAQDEDDNKFVDCALMGRADYIVTNDKHFDVLERIRFPTIGVLSSEQFLKMAKTGF